MVSNKSELSKSFGYIAVIKIRRVVSQNLMLGDFIEGGGNELANIQDAQRFYIVNYFRPSQQIVFI